MPYESRAQQGYMHAAEERGEINPKVVKDFDEATTKKQYARLPEHVRHAVGGFIRHLVHHYFGGGEAGLHHEGSEHDERRDDHARCEHFAHGGSAAEHHPSCPMAQGGEAEEAEYRLEGGEREDDRNAARSPLAEHLAGARVRREALRHILRRPATRVP